MLYHVSMTVNIPTDMDTATVEEIKAREKVYSLDLQRQGIWRHIWRVAGQYENVSIFDCRDHLHLHEVLMGLPLYPYMNISIMPLCRHPSSMHEDDK
ncbi:MULTISPECIES: muconolactone Delta-isomerase [Celeribacter]|uniref:Muconolactone Delta-isomerase n=1 Tax=Celeribacter halophilus TaxID=576117 RepID=A0A1I3WF13_9RHOB|nr:muconolactone Delta-isomerase [Celeribacter halophilus]PZX13144.1 muconolactone delta-isomerase [Celeribacter halophilus]SFK05036.1 muconolactone delta-isomerase [Celeribacter halophilus]